MSYTVGGRAAGFTITEIAVDPAYYDKYGVWTVGVWVQTDGDCSELWKTFPLGNCFLEYTLDL